MECSDIYCSYPVSLEPDFESECYTSYHGKDRDCLFIGWHVKDIKSGLCYYHEKVRLGLLSRGQIGIGRGLRGLDGNLK